MRRIAALILVFVTAVSASAQIRNRLGVGNELYLKYA